MCLIANAMVQRMKTCASSLQLIDNTTTAHKITMDALFIALNTNSIDGCLQSLKTLTELLKVEANRENVTDEQWSVLTNIFIQVTNATFANNQQNNLLFIPVLTELFRVFRNSFADCYENQKIITE